MDYFKPVREDKVSCTQYTVPGSTVDVWDWRIPRYEFNYKLGNSGTSILIVDSPFHNTGGFSFYPNVAHFAYHPGEPNDYQVEDGWELLYRNFGSADEAVGEASFGLYNRYDARVRIFFYIEPNGESPYQNARITAKYHTNTLSFKNVSALFEHLNIPANALSEFDKSELSVGQLNEVIINGTWMYLEFVAAYDPCVCLYPSAIEVKPVLSNISDISFSLEGSATSTAVYSSSAAPPFIGGLARAALGAVNGATGAIVSGFKTYKVLGEAPSDAQGLIGVLANKLPQFTGAIFGTKLLAFLIGGGKSSAPSSLMGFNQDFIFQADGEITTYAEYEPVLLYTPGSFYDDRTPSANQTVYDNPLGVFSILEPPVVERWTETEEYYNSIEDVYELEDRITYKFRGGLKYTVNTLAGLGETPIRIMGSLVFHGNPDELYNTPVINIECLSDYTSEMYFSESGFWTNPFDTAPELQIIAVLDNVLQPGADDILFSARYKVEIVDNRDEIRPDNPYKGMTAEEIFDICDPAPPAPVTETRLRNFCTHEYDPKSKSLKDNNSIGVLPTAPTGIEIPENKVYPNPFSDFFVLTIQKEWLYQETSLSLKDAFGRTVWAKDFYFENEGQLQINQGIDLLPAGQYYLQLRGERYNSSLKLLKH